MNYHFTETSFESHETSHGQKLPLNNLAHRSKLIETCQGTCAKYCPAFSLLF